MEEDPLTKVPDKISYEVLWKAIIRPPRDDYKIENLGPKMFRFNGRVYQRTDYEILDFQGDLLKLSFLELHPDNRPNDIMPCVVYLHANSSSRVEGLQNKLYLLKKNINLCCFDFAGAGKSEGKYISLGYHEKNEVKNVIDFIERLPGVGNIGLWGRSMGAATTLLYTPNDKRIKCIVVDSPFSDFRKLAKEMCQNEVKIPGLLIEGAISIIGKTVYSKNGMDINDVKTINSVEKCFVPCMFIHAYDDTFVPYKHSEKLFKKYGGSIKKLKGITGGHNGVRPKNLLNEVGEFFADYLIPGYMESKQNILYINNNTNTNTNSQSVVDSTKISVIESSNFIKGLNNGNLITDKSNEKEDEKEDNNNSNKNEEKK